MGRISGGGLGKRLRRARVVPGVDVDVFASDVEGFGFFGGEEDWQEGVAWVGLGSLGWVAALLRARLVASRGRRLGWTLAVA